MYPSHLPEWNWNHLINNVTKNYMANNSRAVFVTKLGGIAAAVGSAVGLGNIWRFPYETGTNGGAAFILIYILCVLFLGTPLMLAELTLGRLTHSNPVGAYKMLAPKAKGAWSLLGYAGALAMLLIVGFYSVVAGWTLSYSGGAIADNIPQFSEYSQSLGGPIVWLTIFIVLNAAILLGGVQKGIERASNILVPFLGVILIVLCVNSLMLPKANLGLDFLFHPDFSKINASVVVSALGQSFFSISVGISCLLTYGSYLGDDTKLGKTAISITFLDTLIAILAGIIIFPACYQFNVEPGAGPGLAFITLPEVFQQMPGGYWLCVAFFILLAVAALTSTLSMFETPIAILQEEFHLKRTTAVIVVCIIGEVLGLGCALSFVPEYAETFSFFGYTLFDAFDKVTANIIMPTCGIFMALFAGWVVDKKLLRNAFTNNGKEGAWYYSGFLFVVRYFAPICILLIFLSGLGILG